MEFQAAVILDPSDAKVPACTSMASDAEADLIARAKADPEAFAILYRRHYRAVAGCLFRRTGDVHLAEDLAAETFVSAYRSIRGYRPSGAPFRYWLLRIATNAANRWARRSGRANWIARARAAIAPAFFPPPGETGSPSGGDAERLHLILRRLSAAQQAAISLHYFEGLSVEETATVLGCSVGTVKSRLSRARAALRERLGEEFRP